MKKIYRYLLVAVLLSIFNSSAFSQNPACANFSGVFIADSLEQNFPEYYICSGSNIYLKSINTPSNATFQWKKNGVDISGATTRLLNITSEGLYSLTLIQGACTATSSGIIVRQYIAGSHPYQISANNISQACTGDSIKLSVPKGFGLTYQWKKNNVNITGIPNSSIYKATSTGSYSLSVTQGTCTFNANAVSLNFSNVANPFTITNKVTVCEGKTTTLKASNVNATHTLQWLKDGVAISGANKDSLVVSQTGNYVLQTTKGSCTGNSSGLNLSITNLNLPAPQIQQNYANDFETCGNNVVKLKVKDYNDGALTWLKDGNVIAGQTGTQLLARESGNYAVRYQGNDLCYSQSAVIPVKITNTATMSFAGNNFTVASGQPATINYTFNGVAPILLNVNNTYNMFVLYPVGNNVIDNPIATTTYSATNFANACGVGTFSNPATITVGACSPATQVTLVRAYNNSICIGGSKTISVDANGTAYQWQKEGVDISGETSNNLTISNLNYTNIGNYSLKITGVCGTITEGNIKVNANYGDVVFAKLDYPAYTNSDILLTAFSGSSFGNASNAYRWAGPNGFSSTEQNPVIPNGTASNSGVYTVTATNAGGCVNYALLTVTVTTAPIILGNLGTTSFCPNGTLSIPFTSTLTAGTLYKAYLSDANGNFRNQTEIGMGMTSPMVITFPQYLSAGTKYRIRIVSTSPSATSTLSGYLSTDGQVLTMSVKNLIGREFGNYYVYVCTGSALTGNISSNQSNVTYEWKKDGVSQTNNPTLRITNSGNYVAYVNKIGCNSTAKQYAVEFRNIIEVAGSTRTGGYYQCAGSSILFKEQYQSDSASYQWKRDGINVVGATKDTLVATQTGTYIAQITDKCPISQTPFAEPYQSVLFSNTIDNINIGGQESRILCGNNSYTFIYGGNFSTNPLAPYSYQWKRNGVDILYQTNSNIFVNTAGVYSLSISQGNCTNASDGINVSRVDTLKLALKVTDGYSNTICTGMTTELNTDVPYGVYPSLYKDGILTSQVYGSQLFVTETGKYHLNTTIQGCTIISSDTINIIVGDKIKPNIKGNPLICQSGNSNLYSLIFYVPANVTYQWFKNNQAITFATNGQITVNQAGYYKVRVTSGSCTGFSDSIKIKNVNVLPKPKIYSSQNDRLSNISSLSVCNGGSKYLYSIIEGSAQNIINDSLVRYDSTFWKRNGQIIAKISNDYANGVNIYQSGMYTIIGKKGTCQTESDPVEIKIGDPITANITGSTSIYPGQKAKLNLNFTGGNAWSYQTSDVATGQTTSSSPMLKNVAPTITQTYSITSVASNCGVGTVTGNATVTVLPCPTNKTISVNSGNWNINATWTCGQIPTPTLDTIIDQGHTVSLPNGYQGNAKKLELKGGIKQGVGASLRVSN